ncbi:hypothetical protein [Halegenticoccus soli]|uniref:hypothetical protein n=1 Tax=Halegenticoccus soli TaxID=1985678 RepID=UPI001179A5D6|nr:hypothetical protein [Halegenticoccus soli]
MNYSVTDSPEAGVSRRGCLKIAGAAAASVAGLRVGTSPSVAQSGEAVYRGVANTVIFAGDGISVTEHAYQRNVVVVFGPPKRGGLTETNPFGLFIGPADPNETGQPGHLEVHSAVVVGGSVFQFWEIQPRENGAFAGTLTDPHNQEAIAANLINVETPLIPGRPQLGVNTLPKAMGEGTQLVGAATESETAIRLQGATIDQFTQFDSQMVATRVA